MKVDILIAVAEQGGVESIINMMIPYLKEKRGWEIRVVQLVFEGKYWTDDQVEFYPLIMGKEGHTPNDFVSAYTKFLLENKTPDMILATAWPLMCYVGKKAAALIGKQDIVVLSWLHTIAQCYENVGYGKYAHLALADGHLAISRMIYDDLRVKLPDALIIPVHNPVNMKVYSGKRESRQNNGYKKLYYIGRISGEKRLDIIIKAWEKVTDKWELYIIGDGDEGILDNARAATKEFGADGLHWLGWKENPWEYAYDGDALVLASEYEGFPLTAIEALTNGIPVISTPVSGITELITPGENGYIFPHNDWEALAEILDMIGKEQLPAIAPEKCKETAKIFRFEKALSDFACKIQECRQNRKELFKVKKNRFLYGDEKISVIIPCHNVEEYIAECLDSVLQQEIPMEMLEIIIVDDLSTDNTASIVEKYERNYPENILFIKCEEKIGVGAARNIGMTYASGDYIAFLDADDRMNSAMLQKLYEKMALYELDMAGCGFQSFQDTQIIETYVYEEKMYHLNIPEEKKEFIVKLGTKNSTWAHMYRRDFLEKNQILFPERIYMEDLFFHQMCMMQAESYYEIKEPLYLYRMNPTGVMHRMNSEYFLDVFKMQKAAYETLSDKGLQKGYEKELAVLYYVQGFVNPVKYMKNQINGISWDEKIVQMLKENLLMHFPDITENSYILSDTSQFNKEFLGLLREK